MIVTADRREARRLTVSANCLPRLSAWALLIIGLFTISACIIPPFNEQDAHPNILLVNDKENQTQAREAPPIGEGGKPEEDYFIGLALSGGGSRAAIFSAAVMQQLDELGILEKVQYISSVSGGSLPAAYYALSQKNGSGLEWNKVKEAVSQNFEGLLVRYLVRSPGRWIKQLTSSYDRTDVMAEVFEDFLFADSSKRVARTEENYLENGKKWPWIKNFSDLPEKPRLLINATNYIRGGGAFTFTNQNFDKLHADLAKLTVGKAVATSAAFPGLLRTSTFADYSTHCQTEGNRNPKCQDDAKKKYLHLFDGGITDNLGIDTLLRVHEELVSKKYKENKKNKKDVFPKGCLIIAVDAYTPYHNNYDSDRPDTRKWDDLFLIDTNNIKNAFNILLQTKRHASLKNLGFDRAHLEHAVEDNLPIGFLDGKTKSVSHPPKETRGVHSVIQEKRAECKIWHIAFTQLQHLRRTGPTGIETKDEIYEKYNEQLDERYKELFEKYLTNTGSGTIRELELPDWRWAGEDENRKSERRYLENFLSQGIGMPHDIDGFAKKLNDIETRFYVDLAHQEMLFMAAYLLVNEQTSKDIICQWIQEMNNNQKVCK